MIEARRLALTALCLVVLQAFAQEIDPHNKFFLNDGVERADMIVAGTFRVTWKYAWFDGWHYSGVLHVEESLLRGKSSGENSIPVRWKERYGATCLVCDKISLLSGRRGIWLLTEKDGQYVFFGNPATFCVGPLPMDCRGLVRDALKERLARQRGGR